MTLTDVAFLKKGLLEIAPSYYTNGDTKVIEKENFLLIMWRTLASFVHYNKSNALIQHAVYAREHGDLIPHAFLTLSILYGSFPLNPRVKDFLKDFIDLLDKDLDEEELRVCEYAKNATGSFYSELYPIWRSIREIYGKDEFDLSVLPPTPYYAYSLLVLNRITSVRGGTPLTQLFGELSVLHYQMSRVLSLANDQIVSK